MIEVRDLKVYYGDNVAVDGLSFEVEKGEVYGLIGPNGAGKTTLLNMLTGVLEPDEGNIRLGKNLQLETLDQQLPLALGALGLGTLGDRLGRPDPAAVAGRRLSQRAERRVARCEHLEVA